MPEGDTEFARRLRHLRHRIDRESDEVIAKRAGVGRTMIYSVTHAGRHLPPPWETAERIIRALGGEPGDFRDAWKAARAGVLLTPVERALTDLDIMRADLTARLETLGSELFAAGEIPGIPVAEYEFGVDQGRPAAWHVIQGCGKHFPLSSGPEFLSGIARHQREDHADGT